MSGTVGNADTWTVVFVDSEGTAVDPDGDVTWTVTNALGRVLLTTTQALAEKTDTGTFQLTYTPTATGTYYVKATAVVGGDEQAPAATSRDVVS